MQDTKNLIKKRDTIYPKLIKDAELSGNDYTASYWKHELEIVKERIESRKKNKQKNDKLYRKAN